MKKNEPPKKRRKDSLGRDIAGKLIALRRLRGFRSGSEAARAIGMNVHSYLRIERGANGTSITTLAKILAAFDATLAELAAIEPEAPNSRGRVANED
jgi:transcriptional regulator with XRE-family HTH domain